MQRSISLTVRAVLLGIGLVFVLACGGETSEPDPGVAAGGGGSADAEHCLDLVDDGRFEAAVDVCARAAAAAPDDLDVADALEQARDAVASGAADAAGAVSDAVEGYGGE